MKKTTDSAQDYEAHALEFLRLRDGSEVGAEVIRAWGASLNATAPDIPGQKGKAPTSSVEVLELACGGGLPVSRELIGAGMKLWAIDASPTLLAVFSDRFPEVEVRCESVHESDLFGRQFHGAVCIGLLFMLAEIDQKALINKVAAALRPGGSFLFSAPLQTGPWTDVLTGTASLSLGGAAYRRALAQAGFERVNSRSDQGDNHYYEAIKASA